MEKDGSSPTDIMCLGCAVVYAARMPKLWSETIEAHRRGVHEAILDTAAALVAEHGLRGVTMARIAEKAGIARATLYKYFSGVEAILTAWHARHVGAHLEQMNTLGAGTGSARRRLEAVLRAFALIAHEHHGTELAALVHRGAHVDRARRELGALLERLLQQGAQAGDLRGDVAADELARYCLHAVAAADGLRSRAAVDRLIAVVLDGLRPAP